MTTTTFRPTTEEKAKQRTISHLTKEAFENAKAKGFHDDDEYVTAAHRLMLIVGEVNEAFEEIRSGHDLVEVYYTYDLVHAGVKFKGLSLEQYEALTGSEPGLDGVTGKPEGVPIEIADVVIRLFDFAGTYGIDLEQAVLGKMAFNTGRPYKHGRNF